VIFIKITCVAVDLANNNFYFDGDFLATFHDIPVLVFTARN